MGAPQLIYIAITSLALLMAAKQHGRPREGKNNFWTTFIGIVIQIGLMYWGGFFD